MKIRTVKPKDITPTIYYLLEGEAIDLLTSEGRQRIIPTEEVKEFICEGIKNETITERNLWKKFGQVVE